MNVESTPVTVESPPGMSRLAQLGLSVLVLVVGLGLAGAMVAMSGTEEQVAPAAEVTPVEVVTAAAMEHVITISTTGTVVAARQVSIIPQVNGQLRSVSDRLKPGGRFQAGEVIARIDSRDYRLSVEQQRSSVEQAVVELALEQGRQETAQREWVLLGGEGAPPDIVARRPQLQAVEASLASARSRLATAELSLQRTALRAPFNTIVITETAEVGQVVGGASIATLVGTDELWVQVSVPVEQLAHINIPGVNAETGSTVTVTQNLGTEKVARVGTVISLSGQLDQQSRTATLIVSIEDPLNLKAEGMPGLPMLPGAFVDVTITGQSPGPTIKLPRVAVADRDHVWIASDGKLVRRPVQVGWGDQSDIYITAGVSVGEKVVVTPMSVPIEGMAVSLGGEL